MRAYINATNDNNLTPLHYAASTGNIHLAEILLQNGACPLIAGRRGGEITARNAQFYSFYFGDGENPSLDRFSDASGERRESALNYAIRDGRNGVDLLLLNVVQGKEPEVGGESSSLHGAATYSNEKAARILLNNGANIHLKDEYDQTPLHIACLHRQMGLVSLLLKRGANINARNFFGRTPLQDAVLDGDTVLSRALLDLGGYIITEKGHKMFLVKLEEMFSNDNWLRPVIRSS